MANTSLLDSLPKDIVVYHLCNQLSPASQLVLSMTSLKFAKWIRLAANVRQKNAYRKRKDRYRSHRGQFQLWPKIHLVKDAAVLELMAAQGSHQHQQQNPQTEWFHKVLKFPLISAVLCSKWNTHKLLRRGLVGAIEGGYDRLVVEFADSRHSYSIGVTSCRLTEAAARNGSILLLEWLIAHGVPVSDRICVMAARRGCTEVLKWEKRRRELCNRPRTSIKHWSAALQVSLNHGHLQVAEWILANSLVASERLTLAPPVNGKLHALQWLFARGALNPGAVINYLAGRGHLEALKWLFSVFPDRRALFSRTTAPIPFTNSSCHQKQILLWAKEAGIPFDKQAFWNRSISFLRWARAAGLLVWTNDLLRLACGRAYSVADLEWLKSEGLPMNIQTAEELGLGGVFRKFRWAAENGCPVRELATKDQLLILKGYAVIGDYEAVKWCLSLGFPCNLEVWSAADRNESFGILSEIVSWAKKNGYSDTGNRSIEDWLRNGVVHK